MQLISTPLLRDGNLKAYYPFNGNLTDVKNGFNLSATSPTYVQGKYGQGLASGLGPQISNDLGINSFGAGVSLVGWFKALAGISGDTCFYRLSTSATYETIQLNYFYNTGSPYIQFGYDSSGHGGNTFNYSWTPDQSYWHHIGITYDGSTEIIYLDGKNVASGSHARQSGLNPAGGFFEFQNSGSNPGARIFGVNDGAVFGRVLSASEIFSLSTDPSLGAML